MTRTLIALLALLTLGSAAPARAHTSDPYGQLRIYKGGGGGLVTGLVVSEYAPEPGTLTVTGGALWITEPTERPCTRPSATVAVCPVPAITPGTAWAGPVSWAFAVRPTTNELTITWQHGATTHTRVLRVGVPVFLPLVQ